MAKDNTTLYIIGAVAVAYLLTNKTAINGIGNAWNMGIKHDWKNYNLQRRAVVSSVGNHWEVMLFRYHASMEEWFIKEGTYVYEFSHESKANKFAKDWINNKVD